MDSSTRRAGLYHFAILLPERKFLADMLQNQNDKCDQVHFDSFADHLVSESKST
jgi:catechol 2,3-dioxygenase